MGVYSCIQINIRTIEEKKLCLECSAYFICWQTTVPVDPLLKGSAGQLPRTIHSFSFDHRQRNGSDGRRNQRSSLHELKGKYLATRNRILKDTILCKRFRLTWGSGSGSYCSKLNRWAWSEIFSLSLVLRESLVKPQCVREEGTEEGRATSKSRN